MRYIALIAFLMVPYQALAGAPAKSIRVAAVCFSTGEQVSGMNKICYYDCLGSQAAITISSIALCPMSINR